MKYLFTLFIILSPAILFAQRWEKLFNGSDLAGWRVHGTEKWFIKQGELVCESGPDAQYGYLSTENEYGDFELRLSFLEESNGNSGVFFHAQVEGTRVSGWQVEVAPPGLHTGGIYESYGRGWLIKPDPDKESILKADQWNDLRVRVKGRTVTTWLNGTRMVMLEDVKIGSVRGRIALQIHDGGGVRVRWKDLRIKRIGS